MIQAKQNLFFTPVSSATAQRHEDTELQSWTTTSGQTGDLTFVIKTSRKRNVVESPLTLTTFIIFPAVL